MNKINTTPSKSDVIDAKGRTPSFIANETLERLKSAAPYSCTFIEGIPRENKATVEQQLKAAFESWANSWVAPALRQIIAKSKRNI